MSTFGPLFSRFILRPAFRLAFFGTFLLALLVLLIGAYHTSIYVITNSWNAVITTVVPATALAAGLGVFLLPNPVHNLLCLIGVFFNTAILYLAVEAEFLALVFLIVYIGAIAILFLFVIMLLNVKSTTALSEQARRRRRNSALLTLPFVAKLLASTSVYFTTFATVEGPFAGRLLHSTFDNFVYYVTARFQDILIFTTLLYTEYAYLFILITLLLLIAMLGAIVLAADVRGNTAKSV